MAEVKKPQNDKQIQFFTNLINNKGHVAQAAEAAGYTREYGYELARKYSDYITERVEGLFYLKAIKAANVMTDMLVEDGTTAGAKLRLDAAEKILDRIGIVKQERLKVEIEGVQGIFILPEKEIHKDD